MIRACRHAGADLLVRYYTQAELDRQYRVAETVPELPQIIERYAARSKAARNALPCELSVPYGPTQAERLDIFPARSSAAAPVFVFFHGGFWRALDSRESAFMAETLTALGICVVAVNFGLAPTVSLGEIVRQCRAATWWTNQHIGRFGGDPRRLHIAGSSAGAHLAAMVGAARWDNDAQTVPPIASLTLLSGIYDLAPLRLSYVNDWLDLDSGSAAALSPIHALPPPGTSILASYGEQETDEFRWQTERYLAAAEAAGCSTRFVPVPGTNHFDLALALCDAGSPLVRALRDLYCPSPQGA